MKVLILSATTGGGHMTAANALKDYIETKNKDAVVKIEDTLQIICKEPASEECVPHAVLSEHSHLAGDNIKRPILFSWRHEIYA